MTPLRWYSRVRLLGWLAGVSWEVFCFASGYPRQGHVCDWSHLDPLPCDLVKAVSYTHLTLPTNREV